MRYPLMLMWLVAHAACAAAGEQEWRDPSPHQVRFVTVDSSVKLEVLDWGGSGAPIVLLGCYLTGHVYDDFAPELTNQFHVYGFTRRGIGASDRPPGGYDLQRSVDDLGVKPDGSLGPSLLSPVVRQAITMDARRKPDYARVRVPVLAIFRTSGPFEGVAKGYVIQNDLQRAALRQRSDAEKVMIAKWENDLRAGVPAAKIVELPGASLYMFLSHEADVLREVRAFVR